MSRRIIFGIRPVEELCRAQPRDVQVIYVADGHRGDEMETAIAVAKDRGIPVETRPRALIADLAESPGHQGIVAVAGEYKYAGLNDILEAAKAAGDPPLVLLLDGITDPQNLGALVRSAEVLGAHGVVIPDKQAAPVAGGAVKASAGATERMRIARVGNLLKTIDFLRGLGLRVLGTVAGEGSLPDGADLTGPIGLVIGSEDRGLREAVARRCDGLVTIPMRGQVASLNASAAGAILLYEAARQRGAAKAKANP